MFYFLIQKGADLNVKVNYNTPYMVEKLVGDNALDLAIDLGMVDVIRFLVESGVSITRPGLCRRARRLELKRSLKTLLDLGAVDINGDLDTNGGDSRPRCPEAYEMGPKERPDWFGKY